MRIKTEDSPPENIDIYQLDLTLLKMPVIPQNKDYKRSLTPLGTFDVFNNSSD